MKVFSNVSSDVPGNWRDGTSVTSRPLLPLFICNRVLLLSVQGALCRLCSQYDVVRSVFLELRFAKACLGFRETKIIIGGRVLLAVVNLYVRITIRVATFDTNLSVTDNTQSNVASIQKLPDSVVKSAELAIDSGCIWRIDQF